MADKKAKDVEVTAYVDTLPNLVRLGLTKEVEDVLKERFEKSLPDKIMRYGKLPYLLIQFGPFTSLLREVRHLYVEGFYRAAVALCGMTVEALCITIAMQRVNDDKPLKKQLTDSSEWCRRKIDPLKKYLRIAKSASLLHCVLDIRKQYVHLHKTRVLPEDVLECINMLHLIVIAEYGLVPAKKGKVQPPTEEYIHQLARDMKLRFE